ncbi:MAG: 3-oxoacyl-[acyl-carrier-protein] synthase [Chloroflexota bacterium]|nr:3-oxoacyl-[acyl-carrier-protein] synthase [Chloroflexota bacterium]
MGVVTPAGNDLATFWETHAAGRSSAAPIRGFDATGLPTRFACEVADLDPSPYLSPQEARRLDRSALLGAIAVGAALADAGELDVEPARRAVISGSGFGGLIGTLEQHQVLLEQGPRHVSPRLLPRFMPNAVAAFAAARHGWTGPNHTISTACTASAHAIGEGLEMIRAGRADAVLVGGADAPIHPLLLTGFGQLGAQSTRNDDPARASRPFDRDRDGLVAGEGAAFLVLERLDAARARGATIAAELVGYGSNSDAYHPVAPRPDGSHAAAAMVAAIEDAGMTPSDIGHVNAHATATPLGDLAEARALATAFAGKPPAVTAPKGVMGHMMAAGGAAELVLAILAVTRGMTPPTANFGAADDGVDLDVVCGGPRRAVPAPAISNSFAFGGHNVSLVVAPPS